METNSDTLLKQRAVIEFFHAEVFQDATEIHRCLLEVYGISKLDVSKVSRWVRKATLPNKGETSIHDDPRSGRLIKMTTDQHHVRVDVIIWGNRRIRQSEIASMLPISKERLQAIMADLNYRKICVRWLPRQLTEDTRKQRVDVANEILDHYRREDGQFLHKIVTGDETWVDDYDPGGEKSLFGIQTPKLNRRTKV